MGTGVWNTKKEADTDTKTDLDMFVASDLDHFTITKPHRLAPDFKFNGKIFRRLDGKYFTWLYKTVIRAGEAARQGKVKIDDAVQTFNEFALIFDFVWEKVGPQNIETLMHADCGGYLPPGKDAADAPTQKIATSKQAHTPRTRRSRGGELSR